MIVVFQPSATREEIDSVSEIVRGHGLTPLAMSLAGSAMLVTADSADSATVSAATESPAVERVVQISGSHRLTTRSFRAEDSHVQVGRATFGSSEFVVVAGPCAVESPTQMGASADAVRSAGATVLRGGAFKPRTSPYSFQGLGLAGLTLLAEQRARTGLPIVTEVVTPKDVDVVAQECDMLQIGTRNMQNFDLLRAAGASGRPVLLKRGMAATIDEWLHAAEYLMHMGNGDVVLCERGIRSFDRSTRFTLDLSAVAEAKRLTHLPVIVDPSHSTGQPHLVGPMSLAAAACGADGLIVDVHTDARNALCDGYQALSGDQFAALMGRLGPVVNAVGRSLPSKLTPSLTTV